jgi:hypothetical protein
MATSVAGGSAGEGHKNLGERRRESRQVTCLFAAAVVASVVLVGGGVAYAGLGFVLSESQAGAGDTVHYSISGTDEDTAYEIEIGDHEVAEGHARDDAVSGVFTMPDLGKVGKLVTVEAKLVESGETRTLTQRLRYVVPQPAPAPGQAAPGSTSALQPEAQSGPTSAPSRPQSRRRRGLRRRTEKRHPRRAPARSHERRGGGSPARRGDGRPSRSAAASATGSRTSRRHPAGTGTSGPSTAGSAPPESSRGDSGSRSSPSGSPPIWSRTLPVIDPPTLGIAGAHDGRGPLVPLVVVMLLSLVALTFVARGRQEDDEGEVLRGVLHRPGSHK